MEELDVVVGKLIDGFAMAYEEKPPLWLVASEYVITAVDHVSYPNRVLREPGLLAVSTQEDGEHLDLANSQAWAMVDHQFSYVFIRDRDPSTIESAQKVLASMPGVAEVLTAEEVARYEIQHELGGDLVVISEPNSWQAYYWWLDDARAPGVCANGRYSQKARGTTPWSCFGIRRLVVCH